MNEDTRRLFAIIDKLPHLRVAVWGDYILDEYVTGCTRRISREAPVLILSFRSASSLWAGRATPCSTSWPWEWTPYPSASWATTRRADKSRLLLGAAGADTWLSCHAPGLPDTPQNAHPGRRRQHQEAADPAHRP